MKLIEKLIGNYTNKDKIVVMLCSYKTRKIRYFKGLQEITRITYDSYQEKKFVMDGDFNNYRVFMDLI